VKLTITAGALVFIVEGRPLIEGNTVAGGIVLIPGVQDPGHAGTGIPDHPQ
jgi:hypothetical protein